MYAQIYESCCRSMRYYSIFASVRVTDPRSIRVFLQIRYRCSLRLYSCRRQKDTGRCYNTIYGRQRWQRCQRSSIQCLSHWWRYHHSYEIVERWQAWGRLHFRMHCNGGYKWRNIRQLMLDRDYSLESMISECIKSRKSDFSRPVDVIATVRNSYRRFNPRGPWKFSTDSFTTASNSDESNICFGRPFCLDGEQCALGANGEMCYRRVFSSVLREHGVS